MSDNKKIEVYQVEQEHFDIILNANENTIDFHKSNPGLAKKIQDEILKLDFNRYPDSSSLVLRQKYAKYAGTSPENIVCGNGSDEFISLIIQGFTSPGDTIVFHSPTFSMYKINAIKHDCNFIALPDKANFALDIDGIISTANKCHAKIIFLCNPNNPTGVAISRQEIVRVLDNTQALLVVDEAYFEFYGETVIDLIGSYKNLIVMRTLSKCFGLAGLRVGFAISNYDNVAVLNSIRFPYNLNAISQQVACVYLDYTDEILQEVECMKARRFQLYKELSQISYLQVFESQSNFLYARCACKDALKAKLKGKIAIRFFDDDFIRITIGTTDENNKVLILLKELENETS
ncbi:MAG: histidinol-phosphate transaminase [Coriobacteriales bacterium]|nr:histidinol-phosphate transaminase [Coriobacteriales bacterium]